MRKAWLRLALLLAAGLPSASAAQPTFSVDFQGPSVSGPVLDGFFGVPISDGDILTASPAGPPGPNLPGPSPLPPPGIEVGAALGAVGVAAGGLGVLPSASGCFEVDALSYGVDLGDTFYFSVDEFAFGIAGTLPNDVAVTGAGGIFEASGDVFRYVGPVVPTPPALGTAGNLAAIDGDGSAGAALPGTGLIEPNGWTLGSLPDPGDNLDAVDVDTLLVMLGGPIFLSLDSSFVDPLELLPANCGTAAANGFSGADVLVSVAGGAPALAVPSVLLGLDAAGYGTDDLDALAFDDADGSLSLTGGDTVFFSLRRGSLTLGVPDSAFGLPIEPGDILTLPASAGAPPAIFVAAEALGLATARSGTASPLGSDDLDALDLAPQPASPPVTVPVMGPLGVLALIAAMATGPALGLGTRRERPAVRRSPRTDPAD